MDWIFFLIECAKKKATKKQQKKFLITVKFF